MGYIERISEIVDAKKDNFIHASDKIWEYAETRFEEFNSKNQLCDMLKQEGFTLSEKAAGIETAFIGSFGSGKPVVAILGEYDALFGLSQEGGVAKKCPIFKDGAGHGCGHNLLGVGSLAGAVALKDYFKENHLQGTIRYYGCPAEESGYGKPYLVRAGLFEDVDFAITWHPYTTNSISIYDSNIVVLQMYFRFTGISAHAAGAPHLGRSALDAVELMNVGINYLREHVIDQARIHYAVTNTGGKSPNVVQSEAENYLFIRAPKFAQAKDIYERVANIARGAALMTDTKLEILFDGGCSDLIPNKTLALIMDKNLRKLGAPPFDENDLRIAKEFRDTLTESEKNSGIGQNKALKDKVLADIVDPFFEYHGVFPASTDVGDVSWVVPTVQCTIACAALGTQMHSWQLVAQGKTSVAHKGMLSAGKVIAATVLEVIQNAEIIENAKKELAERLAGGTYECPIPTDVQPSIMR